MSYKNYFVLTELEDYDRYPTLVRIKDYFKKYNPNTQNITSEQMVKALKKENYKIIFETDKNLILSK